MSFSTNYSFRESSIFDIRTLIEALRIIIINAILAVIFLFLIMEEIDWTLFSSRENITDITIDKTSWNINFF
tara:strand:- start:284 stop:499 length:216 start_codon:yes stop_codon:yes gene_type:complete